jgi:hypothetical protein
MMALGDLITIKTRINLILSPIFQHSNISSFHKKLLSTFDLKAFSQYWGGELKILFVRSVTRCFVLSHQS